MRKYLIKKGLLEDSFRIIPRDRETFDYEIKKSDGKTYARNCSSVDILIGLIEPRMDTEFKVDKTIDNIIFEKLKLYGNVKR